jgi:hypothetical protein
LGDFDVSLKGGKSRSEFSQHVRRRGPGLPARLGLPTPVDSATVSKETRLEVRPGRQTTRGAPAWPGQDRSVEEIRRDPSPLAGLGVAQRLYRIELGAGTIAAQ